MTEKVVANSKQSLDFLVSCHIRDGYGLVLANPSDYSTLHHTTPMISRPRCCCKPPRQPNPTQPPTAQPAPAAGCLRCLGCLNSHPLILAAAVYNRRKPSLPARLPPFTISMSSLHVFISTYINNAHRQPSNTAPTSMRATHHTRPPHPLSTKPIPHNVMRRLTPAGHMKMASCKLEA